MALSLLVWCTQRAGGRVQLAAFLMVEAVYIWLHVKPLVPLMASSPVPAQPDVSFLQCYTTGAYFATELVLFWLLAFASPIRWVVPRAVLAVHAAFHTLYTMLATFARRWCLQQNIQRLQARDGRLSWQSLWDTVLNVLNGADAALHVWYFVLLAAALEDMR
ncbi:hypothetical protein COCOBI_07-1270 [Coccomyxa sp. Obi]|nr:hypothetical protein COCOBI_07-1270 [Coccomyxa sp. Obi]